MANPFMFENPSLAFLANELARIDPDGTYGVYYHGTVLALWENGEPFPLPGVAEVAEVFALDGLIQLFTTNEAVGVDAEPVAPFRIEIVPPGGSPSQPVYHIPYDPTWIIADHDPALPAPEARTRQTLIDPALAERGWTGNLLAREVAFRSVIDNTTRRVDYALSAVPTGQSQPVLIAYLEAKHEDLPPGHGLEQARLYAEGRRAHIRWVFSTNGRAFVQYDRLTHARSGPLPLAMFPTPQELAAAYQPDQAIDSPVLSPGLAHPASARRLDRADPAVAQAVIERLLAPTDRPSVVYLLVQSIQQVHTVHPGCWSLTLDSTYIRLNIGKMEVCAIFPGQGRLILDVAALTDAAQVQAEQYALLSQPGVYQTVPTSMLCDGLAEHVPALLPIVRSSYDSLLQKAAQTVKRRTKYAASHASGLVQYLRQATGLDVPNPIYD